MAASNACMTVSLDRPKRSVISLNARANSLFMLFLSYTLVGGGALHAEKWGSPTSRTTTSNTCATYAITLRRCSQGKWDDAMGRAPTAPRGEAGGLPAPRHCPMNCGAALPPHQCRGRSEPRLRGGRYLRSHGEEGGAPGVIPKWAEPRVPLRRR